MSRHSARNAMIHSAIHSAATHLRHTGRARSKPAPANTPIVFRCARSMRQHCGERAALNTTACGAQGCRRETSAAVRTNCPADVGTNGAGAMRRRCRVAGKVTTGNCLRMDRRMALRASANCVRPVRGRRGCAAERGPRGRHLDTMRRSFHQWEQSLVTAYCHSVSCSSCASRRLQP